MAYILKQYNKNRNSENDIFMTYLDGGPAERRRTPNDSGVVGNQAGIFEDEACHLSVVPFTNYYFHGRIKRMTDPQIFYIKLVNWNATSPEEKIEQYVKTIIVAGGEIHEWVDVEFMFTPLITFDGLLFELQRTVDDYRKMPRYPIIAFQELSRIDNLISNTGRIPEGSELIKIGVQSRPGLMMCINGEEIHTPRSGIYELKNGTILVTFFSVIAPGKEINTDPTPSKNGSLNGWMNWVNDEVDKATTEAELQAIKSRCFFSPSVYPKTRTIDSFTLDYMYRTE